MVEGRSCLHTGSNQCGGMGYAWLDSFVLVGETGTGLIGQWDESRLVYADCIMNLRPVLLPEYQIYDTWMVCLSVSGDIPEERLGIISFCTLSRHPIIYQGYMYV